MKYCERCKASAANNWLFCVKCGCYIGNDTGDDEIEYQCKKCGVSFFGGEYCPLCGSNATDGANPLFGEGKVDAEGVQVGMQVSFGSYPFRDPDEPVPIEWIVLDRIEDKVLLLSKYALDGHRYHGASACTWEECEMREWLLTRFADKAFTKEEYAQIANVAREERGEILFEDKIFLLNDDEFCRYIEFSHLGEENQYLKNCYPTEYASHSGAKRGGRGTCQWWLRKDCRNEYDGKYVTRVNKRQRYMDVTLKMGVRPAMWVKLNPFVTHCMSHSHQATVPSNR